MSGINKSLLDKTKTKKFKESDLIELHHDFIMCYGWIPIEEFKQIPSSTFLNLNHFVQEEKRKREELRLVLLKFCGVKNLK
jgi:hypothetical protein